MGFFLLLKLNQSLHDQMRLAEGGLELCGYIETIVEALNAPAKPLHPTAHFTMAA